jgi:hypothetical protein
MQNDKQVNWVKGRDGWLQVDTVNLQDQALDDAVGIYVIWSSKSTIKIGSGRIRDEIAKLKADRDIANYQDLMISWCTIEPELIEGVMNYLINTLKPVISGNETAEIAISVNKPLDRL